MNNVVTDLSLNLRVYITGGGCSGFQYGFTFDQEIREDDLVVTKSYNDENLTAFNRSIKFAIFNRC